MKITQERIDEILRNTEFHVTTVFGKTTVVTALLPNGYTVTEASGCVDVKNYDQNYGASICKKRITDRIWALEGYLLQDYMGKDPNGPCGPQGKRAMEHA